MNRIMDLCIISFNTGYSNMKHPHGNRMPFVALATD